MLITPYPYACIHDVYNAAPACIIYSYSCPSLCIPTYTLLLRTYGTTRSPSLCMCIYTYLSSLVYYTVHAPYHHCGYSAASYTSPCALPSIPSIPYSLLVYRHNMSYDMSSYHLIIYDTMYHHLRSLLHGMCHSTLRTIYGTLPPYLGLLDTMVWSVHMDIHTTTRISTYPPNPWNPWNP